MIKSIKIQNFKSIKEKYFPLKNLNLLLGLNGMGKSSFIQVLLALKQSQNLPNGRLDLKNESYINLGSSKDVLYQYSKKKDLVIEMKFESGKELKLDFKYKQESDYFLAKNIKLDIYGQSNLDKSIFTESLFTENFQYLNANRSEPKAINLKSFSNVVDKKNIGNHGEYAAHFIEVYNGENIEFENYVHKDSISIDEVTGKEIINKTLINQINLWMGEISPNINVRTTSISSDYVLLEYVYKQPNFGNTNRFKPENVGFGITYGLPIVVGLLSARPGELIVIENPESHIHPRGQAELGKLIAKVAMNNVQVIVETHSDHILNGIRVAVKEGDISKDKVALFYFERIVEPDEQYSKITNIEIDSSGELSDYPLNMIDEWSNQLLKLI
jgi:predicted ATPase